MKVKLRKKFDFDTPDAINKIVKQDQSSSGRHYLSKSPAKFHHSDETKKHKVIEPIKLIPESGEGLRTKVKPEEVFKFGVGASRRVIFIKK
mmetsp:Transcript_29603/g.45122  ORF Transcript_29603/g.45122 Transcript_29603/m.45122 type:complete len:91 (-) Transcript_29603:4-276(-)